MALREAEYLRLPLDGLFGSDGTRSELETKFLALCRRHRLPTREVNARLGPYTVDFLWGRQRLVVEVDTDRTHGGAQCSTRIASATRGSSARVARGAGHRRLDAARAPGSSGDCSLPTCPSLVAAWRISDGRPSESRQAKPLTDFGGLFLASGEAVAAALDR
jgi:hypothetical protein